MGAPCCSEATGCHASLNLFLPSSCLFWGSYYFVSTPQPVLLFQPKIHFTHLWASLGGTGANLRPAQGSQCKLRSHSSTSGELWKRGWGKEKKKAESSQPCNNAQIRFNPSRYRKIKAALFSTERINLAEGKNYSSSLSAQTSTVTCIKRLLWQPRATVLTDTPCSG